MKRLLLALFLVLSLCVSFSYADSLVPPFTKAKQIVEERGKEVEPGLKALEFKIEDKIIAFVVASNGNVGIVAITNSKGTCVMYDADTKIYLVFSMTLSGTSQPIPVTEDNATTWAFSVFRFLVGKGAI